MVVASPPRFIVVALEFTKLNVVELVVISPPFIAMSPVSVIEENVGEAEVCKS